MPNFELLAPKLSLKDSCEQCDQIGQFLKDFGEKLRYKTSQNVWSLLGDFEKHQSLRSKKMLWPVFWQFLEKFGYFLFQHLVTLPVNPIYVRTLNRGKITGNNFQIKTLFYICRGEQLWRNVKLQKVKLLVCAKLFTSKFCLSR